MIQTLADALAHQGYDTLTPVQEAVTDPALVQKDLLVSAQTGSGKTVGFGLAIGPTILPDDGAFGPAGRPLALIIAPTRELALQVKRELQWLYSKAGAVIASTVGGMDFRDERRALERGAHIVVSTPGRLRDHIMRATLDLSEIRAIVLDEADEMLDLGFREDLEFILDEAPATRRTLMFSATVPPMIAKLAKSYQDDAVRISTVTKEKQHSDITYRALPVAQHDADNAIINVLRYYEAPNAIVFANTRAMVTRLTTRLSNRGFSVVALSGELSQQERSHALQAMRDGRARVCVATDVAARGIDLPQLELVIHAELPTNAETLLHRSGRTGRAGRKGVSAMIVPPKMRRRAENLLKWGKLSAEWAAAPSAEEIQTKDEERLLTDNIWAEEFTQSEQAFATRLLDTHSAEKIAAAYLRLFQGKTSAPEDLSFVDPKAPPARDERAPKERKERAPFGPSQWFHIDIGREGKAEARWLLPMICKAGGITKKEIGAIRIQPNETFVEISSPAVAGFLKTIGSDMRLENQGTLSAVDGVPQISERGARPGKRPKDDAAKPQKPYAKPKRAPREDAPKDQRPDGAPRKSQHKKSNFAKPAEKQHRDEAPYAEKPKAKPRKKPEPKRDDKRLAGKPKSNASDPSKRFTPPGGKPGGRKPAGKHGAKPAGKPRSKGGSAPPRRGR
jgi:ATP-dependent RNA helicase DeaD